MKRTAGTAPKSSPLYARIRQILESARASAARSVNTAQVLAYWLIGREIVEEEQKGKGRADYGEGLLRDLAEKLRGEYGVGYGLTNLKLFRKFYLLYAELPAAAKGHGLRDEFSEGRLNTGAMNRKSKTALSMEGERIGYAVRSQMAGTQTPSEILDAPGQISDAPPRKSTSAALGDNAPALHRTWRGEPWYPGYGLPCAMRERARYGG